MNAAQSNEALRILHVEDNPGDVFITRRALKNASITTDLHNIVDGEEAMQFLAGCATNANPRPDLILLDINLPTINGDELLKWMMEQEKLQDIPVIVLSSSKALRDVEKMQQYGAKFYLTKPDDPDEFDQIVITIENFCNTINHGSSSDHTQH